MCHHVVGGVTIELKKQNIWGSFKYILIWRCNQSIARARLIYQNQKRDSKSCFCFSISCIVAKVFGYLMSPGHPTDIGLQLGKACYPFSRRVLGECFYFFCFFTFISVPLSSLSLSFISSISFLPFSERIHKMTHKGWCVLKPTQYNVWNRNMISNQVNYDPFMFQGESRASKVAIYLPIMLNPFLGLIACECKTRLRKDKVVKFKGK